MPLMNKCCVCERTTDLRRLTAEKDTALFACGKHKYMFKSVAPAAAVLDRARRIIARGWDKSSAGAYAALQKKVVLGKRVKQQ